jgi:hypothetical protein
VNWIAWHEVWLVGAAAPFLLFPGCWTLPALAWIVLVWACRWLADKRPTVCTGMELPMVALVAMALVGYIVSIDRAMSNAKLWGIVLQVVVFYAVANGLREKRYLLVGMGVLFAATAAVAVLCLVGTDWTAGNLVDVPWLYGHIPRLIRNLPGSGVPQMSEFFNPREVGATMAMLLPVPLCALLFGQHRLLRYLAGMAVFTTAPILLLTQSPQAFLGLGLALFLIVTWRSRWWLLAIPAGVVALAAALLAYGPQRAALTLLSIDNRLGLGVVLRLDIWGRALAMLHDMPWSGIGLNTFPLIQTGFYPGLLLGPEPHAHSIFLQTALDLGLLGLAAFLGLLVSFTIQWVRAYRATTHPELRPLLIGSAGAVLAYLGFGLVDAVTLGAKPVAALFAIMGAVPAVARLQEDNSSTAAGRRAWRRVLVLAPTLAFGGAFLLLGAIVGRASPWVDLGSLRGHQIVAQARLGVPGTPAELDAVSALLGEALKRSPDNVYLLDLVGNVYAWQGDYAAALAAFARRVALDRVEPMARYAPFISLRRSLAAEQSPGPREDLLQVYTAWNTRFPDRAGGYVRAALLWEQEWHDRKRASGILRVGVAQGAQPAGLLSFYLGRLEESALPSSWSWVVKPGMHE